MPNKVWARKKIGVFQSIRLVSIPANSVCYCSFSYLFIIIYQDLYVLYYVAQQLLHEISVVSHVIFVIFQV